MRAFAIAVLLSVALAIPGRADFEAGMAAYNQGDFARAFREWIVDAELGFAAAQYNVGVLYATGRGVARDYVAAFTWFDKAAAAGHAKAAENLGNLFYSGHGVDRDLAKAAAWYRRAAEAGLAQAQFNLGGMYANGEGLARDLVEAYFWLNLAARGGYDEATAARDRIGAGLPAAAFARVQRRLREWTPSSGAATPSRSALGRRPASTATGFLVSRGGHILTNSHAVRSCDRIAVRSPDVSGIAEVIADDESDDLALLRLGAEIDRFAAFRAGAPVRLGATVAVFGYPLQGILAFGANITNGIVSGLAGPDNDDRLLQATAPVQPGNSGGPLLDAAGNVIGVIVSKLDALKVAEITGDMPQNINFAIRAAVARRFLERQKVRFVEAESVKPLTFEEIAEKAAAFTVMLECWRDEEGE